MLLIRNEKLACFTILACNVPIYDLTPAIYLYFLSSLCLSLLFRRLFHSGLILNDTALKIYIHFKKAHWKRLIVFAYDFHECKYFQLASASHCKTFVQCFLVLKASEIGPCLSRKRMTLASKLTHLQKQLSFCLSKLWLRFTCVVLFQAFQLWFFISV